MIREIEIVTFDPALCVQRYATTTQEEMNASIQIDGITELFLGVFTSAENVSWGAFYAWIAGEIAHVRIDEHCEHYASDPNSTFNTEDVFYFHDNDGSAFSVNGHDVVTRHQAIEALQFWSHSFQRTPALKWN